jgi:hypothetical protein
MEIKMRINKKITSPQILGIFDVTDESKIRIVVEGAGSGNTFEVKARIQNQTSFVLLKTITGNANETVNVFTYEEVQIECTSFSAVSDEVKIVASSFSDAGGSAIDSIGVPSGDDLTDIETLNLTSSDGSINISGDNATKTIDFTFNDSYTPSDATDWSPSPTTIPEALDQLADRTNYLEDNKIDISQKGAPNGVAPLNASTKIDSVYLPSYVDDVIEVSSFSTLPSIGETGKIYVTLDTNKQYRWSGSIYIEVSPSEVNSVNGKVGIVVLNKSDIGLSNVDNTSDLNKPISNATQTELTAIDGRLDNLEEINSVKKFHAFEDNLQIYADARPGVKDPSTNIYSNGLIRDGWYFKNTVAGYKINWYFFDGTSQGTITLGNFSAYAVMTFDAITAYPILAVYTFPTGTGDIAPGFAHSKVVYANPLVPVAVAGVKYLVYFGDEPAAHPELPRIQLTKSTISSAGDQNPAEIVLTASFGSDSGEPVNEVQFMVETLGVNSPTVKQEIDLRIKSAIQSDLSSHIANLSNPHAVTKTQVGLSNVDNTSDLNKPISTATQTALNLKYDASNPVGYITSAQAPVQSVNTQTGAVSLEAEDIPFTPYGTITATEVQSAIEELDDKTSVVSNIATDTKEPTGFVDRTESTTSFDDSSRLFTIQPVTTSFSFYTKGTKFTKTTSQSITIPNLAGNHYVYFNDVGNLATTQTFTSAIIEQYAFVTVIYWNTDVNKHSYFAEERHGITMDGATHIYLHTTFGARYLSGLALQSFTIGDGSLDSHAQFTADEGSIRDEDLLLINPVQSQIPILFRQGQLWRKKAADAFPLLYNDGIYYSGPRIPFNQYVAGSWQLTAVDSNKFVLVHFFATNDKETPVVGIQGIAQYNDIPAARNAASTEITTLSGLPFAEFVAIGTVVFQTNTYANIPDARVRNINGANYVDFRGTQLYTPAGEATEHSLLSGLADDDHIQYLTEARGDARYYTQTQIDVIESTLQADIDTRALDSAVIKKNGSVAFTANQSLGGFKITNLANPVGLTDAVNLQTLNASIGSSGDIIEKSFSIIESQISTSITDFIFPSASIKSFSALVSVVIDATADLSEQFELNGIQLSSGWVLSIISRGDNTNITFDVDSTGQVRYSSSTYSGFVSGTMKFRAFTTGI